MVIEDATGVAAVLDLGIRTPLLDAGPRLPDPTTLVPAAGPPPGVRITVQRPEREAEVAGPALGLGEGQEWLTGIPPA